MSSPPPSAPCSPCSSARRRTPRPPSTCGARAATPSTDRAGAEQRDDGLPTYDSALAATGNAYRSDPQDPHFTGEFRRELDSITFPGEQATAERTVREQEAVEFCTGWEPGTSNAHFGSWMTALDKVTAINETHFSTSVREGRSEPRLAEFR
ncbi:hypothetical protein ABZ960_18435 [Streptomyces pseudovenezuelae]|uniref:hypothetical protein n=1 Tax=Streptomyces pseudovenezuelae TaxID=67350 RepID=UPI0034A502E6